VLASGELAPGRWTKELEEDFARFLGVKHAIATSSGTTALWAAVASLGLNHGDKVFTTPFSFMSTVSVLLANSLVPAYVDIDPVTFNMDPEKLRQAIKEYPETRGLIIVHLYGLAANMEAIRQIASENHLVVIEDCAQAHGARVGDRMVGTLGDLGAFSFYGTKNITTGEGGMVVTDNDFLADRVRMIINHGQKERYYHETLGYNFRMSNVHAAIGVEQLKKLAVFTEKRRANARYLTAHIRNPRVVLPEEPPGYYHVYHQYTVRIIDSRENFIKHLEDNGVGYGIYYPLCLAEQPVCRAMGFVTTGFAQAQRAASQVVSLPVHPGLSGDDLTRIVEVVNSYRG